MKRAILLLVLANLGLYLWRHYTEVPTTDTLPIPADIEQLVLLVERDLAKIQKTEVQETSTEAEVEPMVSEDTIIEEVVEAEPEQVSERSVEPEPQPEMEPVCYGLGPLAGKDEAEQLAEKLAQSGVQSGYRTEKKASKEGFKYLVFIPTSDMEDAKKITAELITHKVSDFYIANRKYIAMGVFSDKDYAMKRMNDIKQLGYTTAVREEGTARIVHWLDALQKDPSSLTPAQRESMLSKYPKATVEAKDCGDIALSAAGP
ncbi:MAG: hypothetical protein V3S33_04425 [Gammaproteobacteria bacterium]